MAVTPTSFTTIPQNPGSAPVNLSVNGGPTVGNPLAASGSDFLNPARIVNDSSTFSGSIKPVGSNTPTAQFVPVNAFGKNPTPQTILGVTKNKFNKITNMSAAPLLNVPVPVVTNFPFIQPVPDLSGNPDPVSILAASTFFHAGIRMPEPGVSPFTSRTFTGNISSPTRTSNSPAAIGSSLATSAEQIPRISINQLVNTQNILANTPTNTPSTPAPYLQHWPYALYNNPTTPGAYSVVPVAVVQPVQSGVAVYPVAQTAVPVTVFQPVQSVTDRLQGMWQELNAILTYGMR